MSKDNTELASSIVDYNEKYRLDPYFNKLVESIYSLIKDNVFSLNDVKQATNLVEIMLAERGK